jgi:GH24 family phage-related lysozyme (muramidase)/LysM repeat protein
MEESGRGGRSDSRSTELAQGAEAAAVKAAEKIAREAAADGKIDNFEKTEAKQAAEQAAKDKVKEAENGQAGFGEFVVQQGDTVWGALRNAGYSDSQIVSQGLVNQVAQASGLQNPDQIRPGDVLQLPTNGNFAAPGQQAQPNPELKEKMKQDALSSGLPISDRAIDLILASEGLNQPGKWPGADSGITLGVGYDLGHVTPEQFRKDWGDKLPADELNRLEQAIGLTGRDARAIADRFSDINISRKDALEVFQNATLPTYFERTQNAFPGMENLSPDVQGVLTSLVINRGESMANTDRREEMRNIRDLVSSYVPGTDPSATYDAIADEIRSMKRLWEGKGVDGLLVRRDAEANLVLMA